MALVAMASSSYLNSDMQQQPSEEVLKLKKLRRLKETVLNKNPTRLGQLLRRLSDLESDASSPVRKFVAQVIGEVGSKNVETIPELMPVLLSFLKDETPAVIRQAITTGTDLFQLVLEKLVIQGLYSSEIDDSLISSWDWMLQFKTSILPLAFQPAGNDGVRLLSVKFVESMILLYTPDPNISPDPPRELTDELGFNISWLRGGHPILSVGELAMEASQNLGLMLDQLKFPQVKSLSSSMIIVFINSLSAVAQRRPSFYGKILPVLLSLDPSSSVVVQIPTAFHALRTAFSECIKCTHSSAEPWRPRLARAMEIIDGADVAEQQTSDLSGKKEGKRIMDSNSDDASPSTKRAKQSDACQDPIWSGIKNSDAVFQLVTMFASLAAQGERAASSLQVLSSSISSELLAEVVLVNLHHLPVLKEELVGPSSDVFPELAALFQSQSDETDITSAPSDTSPEPVPVSVPVQTPVAKTEPKPEPSPLVPLVPVPESTDSKIPGLNLNCAAPQFQFPVKVKEEPSPSSPSPSPSLNTSTTASEEHHSTVFNAEVDQKPSVIGPAQFVLPKMQVSNLELSDEEKDKLQRDAFERIVESDEKLVVFGGAHARIPLLAHISVEFPLELNPWEALQKYILSDYANHEGHELTVRVLYRLYRETEQDQDFLVSRTATSIYDSFLLTVAEAVKNKFPASDKSLGKLLGEAPYLPDGALKLLEGLCCPSPETSSEGGDRVTQGLSCVWSLILMRPADREKCLHIALQSAVYGVEDVRMKAIRLVANKLFPMASISRNIEEFAREKLRSVINNIPTTESSEDAESKGIAEAQRCMSLYFALCTKKHALLNEIFAIFGSIPEPAKQAVNRHIPILVRTIGTSPDLLGIISDPPNCSNELIMKVLQILTEGLSPSRDLITAVKNLYSRTKDIEVLIPFLGYLPKEEILPLLPSIISLPMDKLQLTLSKMFPAIPQNASSLAPSDVLIAIHAILPEKDGVPLKKVMDACSACFELKTIFTQQVLAKALNQLVEQIPLPLLFMRTVIQAIGVFPGLVDFVMEIMSRLVSKQIWKYPKLWVGFVKCAIQLKAFSVLLQLPAQQLENAISKNPILKAPLFEHASQPHICSTLPRSTQVVLGLVQDNQQPVGPTTQTASQSQAAVTSTVSATSKSTGDVGTGEVGTTGDDVGTGEDVAAEAEATEDSAPMS
ncbi:hypothetical protein LUZ60_013056 [Juncus effusus]|nr:hypothetical protein LUZ60_013056 [Juncus effusus]